MSFDQLIIESNFFHTVHRTAENSFPDVSNPCHIGIKPKGEVTMEFTCITKVDKSEFESQVSEHTKDGWNRVGAIKVEYNPNFAKSPVYHQLIIRFAKESAVENLLPTTGTKSEPETQKKSEAGGEPGARSVIGSGSTESSTEPPYEVDVIIDGGPGEAPSE